MFICFKSWCAISSRLIESLLVFGLEWGYNSIVEQMFFLVKRMEIIWKIGKISPKKRTIY